MAFFSWNDNMSVGVKTIDDQHKKLIELINDFYEHILSRSNNENISKLISGMSDYIQMHFRTEEEYMTKFNYPDIEEHKKEHEIYVAKVKKLEEDFNSGKIILSFEITSFLKDWIKNHIQGTDPKYSSLFLKNGVV